MNGEATNGDAEVNAEEADEEVDGCISSAKVLKPGFINRLILNVFPFSMKTREEKRLKTEEDEM